MINAIILNTKTHALNGNAVEIAYYPLELSSGFIKFKRSQYFNKRFNPAEPIDAVAMALHNIIDEDVIGKPLHTTFKLDPNIKYVVSHNVDYDIGVLRRAGVTQKIKHIDTLAIAKNLLPELANHELATLAYFLSTNKPKIRQELKHASSPFTELDLTAFILNNLFGAMPFCNDIDDLYLFSLECRVPKVMAYGQYKGMAIEALPSKYKTWLFEEDKDHWTVFALQLQKADFWRKRYEMQTRSLPHTYKAYQFIDFIDTEEPSTTPLVEIYESVLHKTLSDSE